ncbi:MULTISPECIES: UDP-N-acetylglucosamine 1-carboxyvinyltransferase [Enterococcus]|uniref:UDP-N-acetylglucosamine 1-carboxyvinyltransferase n=1 Tax=Enterococcus malodoratus ATCC 43197 TaxID=1158601 RepID=R2QIS5_9ENTE|nr:MULTISPECIES: UDP-N-acetylglucosamine 1-carboxyvinyltransferase [Enterococcus]BBM19233.1 UDP-N-acetylglucosamine 1-carboxyvinyltransferase [Enterococcus avium]EOH71560.1 UDP-N-acetylglucosamine 1-carboxyvinyltransferase 2 [Enterococcus malodoratus ATCC 43197]EOT69750.1 UDP-N-acetylglucosamine 1-carboxyvinyltransferase 2 [Enterococcus malodoratus ATCC 43197]OJG63877.1 UDP-N-acetylglucosamine 1-carboxyvinyltransferase 2 [Enterococcus malodoratus]SES86791.1 UDP-N-acetylglucosamine 1-carboxyvin
MEEIIVRGGKQLKGTVHIEGAKNAVLPILAATLLAEEGTSTLSNVPILSDVFTMNQVIRYLNTDVEFNEETKEITVDATRQLNVEAPYEYVSKMRASIVVMGPLLARNGHAKVAMPGGCAIGKRPIDLHLKGFQALGAKIIQKNGYIEAIADELVGDTIYLDFPSVGATQNIMMAAVKAKGTTVIENVAREPEIVDLANFLNKMGASIHGAGTETMRIEGVDHLHAVSHPIVQDRIEAGTFMVAAAMTEGNVLIDGAIPEHNRPLISKLIEMGVKITEENDGLRVIGPKSLKATDIKTMPHPGFPTDMQAQMTAIQLVADGVSTTTETVFENRFQHLEEMRRMNAQVKIDNNVALIKGASELQGAEVYATDLRAAAALVLAGLRANGMTRVRNLKYLDRGYYKFHTKLQQLGADVERVDNESKKTADAVTVLA